MKTRIKNPIKTTRNMTVLLLIVAQFVLELHSATLVQYPVDLRGLLLTFNCLWSKAEGKQT